MKIAFYAPCNEFNRQAGPLMGIAYMASYLQEQLGIEDTFLEVSAEKILEQKPDLIAISSFSEKYLQVMQDAQTFKSQMPNVPIVLGGPHISAVPHSLDPIFDVGVIGEGEKPLKSIVEQLLRGGLEPEGLREIKNLIFWDEHKKMERTLFEDRIKDLDALPLPKRSMMKAWWPSLDREVAFDRGVYTSRGCSFRCHFCMYSERANLIRYVSVDKVMEDILDILSTHPEQERIVFYDDLFVIKKARLKELTDAIRSEGLHKRISFGCMAKTSFFDEEFAQILRDMNMKVISWGFESGSDPVLHYLKDRHSTVRKHQDAVDLCERYGIHAGGYFIVGAPPETEAAMAQTYWFIRQNQPAMPLISVFPLIPLPGTSLWRETTQRGLLDAEFSKWDELGFLRLEEDQYLHLNENYGFKELKSAYDTHFEPLMNWTTQVFSNVLPYESMMADFYKQVLPSVRARFTKGCHLLEVNRGERDLSFVLEEEYDLESVFWKDLKAFSSESPFDGVLVTHCLEKFGFDSAEWEYLQSLSCPIYILVENAGHFGQLCAVLQNKFPLPIESLHVYQQNYRFTRDQLLNTLKTSVFQAPQIEGFPFTPLFKLPSGIEPFLNVLSEHLPIASWPSDIKVMSYGVYLSR